MECRKHVTTEDNQTVTKSVAHFLATDHHKILTMSDAEAEYNLDDTTEGHEHEEEDTPTTRSGFTDAQIRFICAKRLTMNAVFNNIHKKRQYWEKITEELKKEWPNVTQDYKCVQKRYQNSFDRYKKEKKRTGKRGTGETPSAWPLFELFDQTLHYRADVSLANTHGTKRSFAETLPDIGRSSKDDDFAASCGYDPVTMQEEREARGDTSDELDTTPKRKRTDARAQLVTKIDEHGTKAEGRLEKLFDILKSDREERASENEKNREENRKSRELTTQLIGRLDAFLERGGF